MIKKVESVNKSIILDTDTCTGCRACELACSYHHQKIFSPSIASIHIRRYYMEEKVAIILYPQGEVNHLPCNCTSGKEFCVQYCPEIAREALETILLMRGQEK